MGYRVSPAVSVVGCLLLCGWLVLLVYGVWCLLMYGVSPAIWVVGCLLLYWVWGVSYCMGDRVSPAVCVVGCLLLYGLVGCLLSFRMVQGVLCVMEYLAASSVSIHQMT